MFVLTHTADVVRNSDEPYLGAMLLAALVIINVVIAVLVVREMHK